MSDLNDTRRKFLKTSAYLVPVILTLKAAPALAHSGSCKTKGNNGVGNGPDNYPNGFYQNEKFFLDNDDHGGTPGDPQNKGGSFLNNTSSSHHGHGHGHDS